MVKNKIGPRETLLATTKRNVLVTKLCIFSTVLALLHIVLDASQGLYQSVVVDAVFAAMTGSAVLLNRRKYYLASKVFVLFGPNLLFAFFTSVLPKDVGIYLYFFPLIVASSALFDSDERYFCYFFIALPLLLLGLLMIFDFDLFRGFQFEGPSNVDAFFAVNAFSSAAVTILCVNFMERLNTSSERELKELAEEVRGKNTHLEKTNAELDRFLYSTSHDLRSPLSSIKGLVNIARMENKDEAIGRYFNMMIDRVDRLDFFIKDIIDYSKNARTDVQAEVLDFDSLIAEITENLKYTEGADAIRFQTQVNLDHAVKADRNRLTIVLNNLIANAIKYHDPRKECQWIDVKVTSADGIVNVMVADNGMGIEKEHHARVFDMFYRGTFQSKGSGLGLYIVKETVAKMRGTIRLESTPGRGSVFMIALPVSKGEPV